jgi:hypothetical protein
VLSDTSQRVHLTSSNDNTLIPGFLNDIQQTSNSTKSQTTLAGMSTKPSSRKRAAASTEPDSDNEVQQTKKAKKASSTQMQTDDDGNEFWEISNKRRLQISEFKKNTMVSIREFYEKDGQMLPGKKVRFLDD